MHCTAKKTLEQIIQQQNDYLVCVKGNQGGLYRWLTKQWQQAQPCSLYQSEETSHGRTVQWRVLVFDQVETVAPQWPGLQRGICVERRGLRDGQAFDEKQFYISSVVTTAQEFHHIIRGHWCIENRLHWVKDVVFNEDHAPQRGRFACANWSVVRNIFISLARRLGFTSMATAKRHLANQLEKVFPLLQ